MTTRRLAMVGGGHAHALVLLHLARMRLPDTQVRLFGVEAFAPYSGMLPGVVAGHYREREAQIDLAPVAARAGVRFEQLRIDGVDLDRRILLAANGAEYSFDWLSLNVGSTPDLAVPGAAEHTVPVKPVSSFHRRWDELLLRVGARSAGGRTDVAVVGAGAGGVELSLAVAHRLASAALNTSVRLHLVAGAGGLLPAYPDHVRARMARELACAGVQLHVSGGVDQVTAGCLHCADGTQLKADEILWVTRASAPPWFVTSGLACDPRGFVRVDATLRSVSHPFVFAAGDCAALEGARLPKAGVFAVRQAPVLAQNLSAVATGADFERYEPQVRYLSLLTAGRRRALAFRHSWWAPVGAWVWHWKDWVDRRFMRRFQR